MIGKSTPNFNDMLCEETILNEQFEWVCMIFRKLSKSKGTEVIWNALQDFDPCLYNISHPIKIAISSPRFTLSTSYFPHIHFSMWKYVCVLHKHSANITRSDASWGSKPPHLRVGAFTHQIRCVPYRGPVVIECYFRANSVNLRWKHSTWRLLAMLTCYWLINLN